MPPRAFDILGFGAVAVDDLLYVEEYPPADSKVPVRRRVRQCGGLTGTALVAAARLGARCAYTGVLGDDELSRIVIDNFASEGIDVAHCVRRPDARPGHSVILVDVVDTTGCGDVFHGAYAAALAEGRDLADRVGFASAAAALKATRAGGQAGIPPRTVVETFLGARR